MREREKKEGINYEVYGREEKIYEEEEGRGCRKNTEEELEEMTKLIEIIREIMEKNNDK